ncbi:hypothetical protein OG497_37675 [Streptomyces sp. NBC_01242]|uniref:hypothetical protein n=1 Tax=Streptomyces sp. NBC_01242 TaxID=2903795 RepID=UPI0022592D9A|nr:hypothetical protein [Streptomyces sp. NBC_01242]MCX4799588.1 hypothetical protein [Streptomyces sp. NBC_01242]
MAQRKKALLPWPENIWHTEGATSAAGLVHEVQAHLRHLQKIGAIQHFREFDPRDESSGDSAWWGFDVGWCTDDGALVRARMRLVPDALNIALTGATRETIAADEMNAWRMSWTVTAVADQRWQVSWGSPVLLFFPARRDLKWDRDFYTGKLSMHTLNAFGTVDAKDLERLMEQLSRASWYTVVITHDRRPDNPKPLPPLADLLPGGALGRVLEIRACGDQDQVFNEILAEHRVSLPWGGSVILPSSPRKDHWASADYGLKVPGGDFDRLLQKTALHVMKYAAFPAHFQDRVRDALKSMQDSWELPEIELEPNHVLKELERARQEIDTLQRQLTSANQLAEDQDKKRREAEAIAEEAQSTVLETMQAYRENPLAVREAEARAQAEEAFSWQETAEALAENLTAEVAWLRRKLAQVPGHSYGEEVPERPQGPESWQEMAALAHDLMPHVRIGDIRGPLKKLENNHREPLWLRHTWEALEALEAYAEAKKEHGPDALPNFRAYLDWPEATTLVSKTMYAASEVTLERAGTDHRGRRTRLFDVEGLGEVFMGAHFRIGGVRPPAPRMHVYDDTCGPTGLIHVGYIGPHLPNVAGR